METNANESFLRVSDFFFMAMSNKRVVRARFRTPPAGRRRDSAQFVHHPMKELLTAVKKLQREQEAFLPEPNTKKKTRAYHLLL